MSGDKETIVIVILETGAPPATVYRLHELLGNFDGPDLRVRIHSPELITFRLDSIERTLVESLQYLDGVRQVVVLPPHNRLYSKRFSERRPVSVAGGANFGDGSLCVIAGPCSVESKEQIVSAAEVVAEAGARALRGGVFKPRTSPYMFGGLGEHGLEYLALARERTGLPVVTEVLCVNQVELVASYADMLQIGSRNMSNFPLLYQAGANSRGRPVLLKRGLAATIPEFLEAAEYVLLGRLSTGHAEPGLILCERGIRTFAPALRFTLDVGAIPLLKENTDLPVIADPSHAAGKRSLVPPLGRAAIAAGADGLLIEVHCNPDSAWCDGEQSVDPTSFRKLMADLNRYVEESDKDECDT
jgi:3-deoxy-7-phosphoheptulonate synthase